jgi:hypothetical protein
MDCGASASLWNQVVIGLFETRAQIADAEPLSKLAA